MSVMNQSGDEQAECPLCMEPLEVDDLNFYPCTCGYQICRFCWNRIREGENGLCPACRKAYPENPADFTPLSQEQVAALKTEKRAREQQRRNKSQESRRQLSSVRVVQKNLVFVVGLPVRLADPEILKRPEYFGKYGKIHKVVINHSTAYAGSQGPSASAYVTYVSSSDALRAIQNVNNVTIDGRVLKGSLGTTKYCANFMRNQPCPKPDCMYLHELGDPSASFTKEEMHQGMHQIYEKKLHEQLIAATAAASASGNTNSTTNNSSTSTTINNNSSNTSTSSGGGTNLMMNGNHSTNSGPSSNSSSTSSLNSSGINNCNSSAGGSFIPSTVVTSSSINIHNAKSKNNSSNGVTSGGVVLSSSSSSTSSSCSRDTWPSLGSSSPPLHSDTQDSDPSPQPSINQTTNTISIQQRNNNITTDSNHITTNGNKNQESNTANTNIPQQAFGKSSTNKNTKNNNKENTNTTNQNSENGGTSGKSGNSKGNASSKKGNKNKSNNTEKQTSKISSNKKDSTSSDNAEKKKSDKDKNKNLEQQITNEPLASEKVFKGSSLQQQPSDKKHLENTELDGDERHSLIDGHDLLEENDHSLLEDDDHDLLKDVSQGSVDTDFTISPNLNLLKKHADMMNLSAGQHSLFAPPQGTQPHNLSQLKDYSGLENSREQNLFNSADRATNNSSAFLDKEFLLLRERQHKELLLKQELLAHQQRLYNAMNSDPTKFLNLDMKEQQQLLLQQRIRQQQLGSLFNSVGMRMDGVNPQQFGLQQQIQNQSRLNGMINDAGHMMSNGIDTHGQGLVNSLSSSNVPGNVNTTNGLANSLSASNLSTGSKLLGVTSGSGNLGGGISSEGRYVGENNMDRFFLDFHRNQQLKGRRTGPLLPPEAPSLAYIESQALQRKYGMMQNGIQDSLGQQLSQLQAMGNNVFQSTNQPGNIKNSHIGNNTNGNPGNIGNLNNMSSQQGANGQQQPMDNQSAAGSSNGSNQSNREDDLDFEWLKERQKLFAELIENDMMLQQGHPNYSDNVDAMQRRARHPPQGFSHMNAFGIGVPRPHLTAGMSPNTGMVADWTQLDPAIMASGLCSNTSNGNNTANLAQQEQQQSLMTRFRNISMQQQQIQEAQRLQNGLVLPQQHNLLTVQQLQYQQQQRKLIAAAMAAQHQQQVAQQQAAQQQANQQQLPNSFWLMPSEQPMNNFQNRNGFYATAAQSVQNNVEMTQNNKYNIPISQAFSNSVSTNASVNNTECIESK